MGQDPNAHSNGTVILVASEYQYLQQYIILYMGIRIKLPTLVITNVFVIVHE